MPDTPDPDAPQSGHGHVPARVANPWWMLRILGRVPVGVGPQHVRLLGFVALAMFFENFDMSLLGAVLKYLAQDFGLDKAELGSFTGAIRLGTLPAFFIIPFADRIGRRRMFLISVVGMSAGTFLTAFSPNEAWFIAFQVLSRSFMLTASAVAFVFITEEFPAEHRGWGIGMLGAVAALGFGVGALLFAAIDVIPFGWRALYAFGFVPVFFLAKIGSGLPETRRFSEAAADAAADASAAGSSWLGPLEPIFALATQQPRHALGVLCLGVLGTAGTAVAFQFTGEFVLNERGWAPWMYTAMFILCGAVGVVGSPWAGRMGDRFGRRVVAGIMLGFFPIWVFAFYMGPGWLTPFSWVGMVFASMSSSVVIRALTNETFPTSRRGTAGGLLSLMETGGATAGLFAFSYWMGVIEDQALVIGLLSLVTVVSVMSLPLFPETRSVELEEIHPDRPTAVASTSGDVS
jgi:MFS family permease